MKKSSFFKYFALAISVVLALVLWSPTMKQISSVVEESSEPIIKVNEEPIQETKPEIEYSPLFRVESNYNFESSTSPQFTATLDKTPVVRSGLFFEMAWDASEDPEDETWYDREVYYRGFSMHVRKDDGPNVLRRFSSPMPVLEWTPTEAGLYTLTFQSQLRKNYKPTAPGSSYPDFRDCATPSTIVVTYRVDEVVDTVPHHWNAATPIVTAFDRLTVGCMYSIPTVDPASLEADAGHSEHGFCVRSAHRLVGSDDLHWIYSPCQPLDGKTPSHLLVIGMREGLEYEMRHEFLRTAVDEVYSFFTKPGMAVHRENGGNVVPVSDHFSMLRFTAGMLPTYKAHMVIDTTRLPELETKPITPKIGETIFLMTMFSEAKYDIEIPLPPGNIGALDLESMEPIWYAHTPYNAKHYPDKFGVNFFEPNIITGDQTILFACGAPSLDMSPSGDSSCFVQNYIEMAFDGAVVHEMNVHEMNYKVQTTLGWDTTVVEHASHHDVVRLPGDKTLVMIMETVYRNVTGEVVDLGPTPEARIFGSLVNNLIEIGVSDEFIEERVTSGNWDAFVLLDKNWDVEWGWRSYEHIAEGIKSGRHKTWNTLLSKNILFGQGPQYGDNNGHVSQDVTHFNAFTYDSDQDNLFISSRSLDLMGKVDISLAQLNPDMKISGTPRVGEPTGELLWSLHEFKLFDRELNVINTTTREQRAVEFSSRQHLPYIIPVGQGYPHHIKHLTMFDNNVEANINSGDNWDERGASDVVSQGRYFIINEKLQEAVRVVTVPMPGFCVYLGSSQMLPNGNFFFTCGGAGPYHNGFLVPGDTSYMIEADVDGEIVMALKHRVGVYRGLRTSSINTSINPEEPIDIDVSRFIPAHWIE